MKQMKKRALALLCCLCLALTALPLNVQAAGLPFTDVKPGDWMYSAVDYVYRHNLMQGSGSGFSPNGTLTRGMFVTILGRMAGVDKANYQGAAFSDVQAGQWYAPYVQWAYQKGITNGSGNNTFGVNRAITRQEMASMVNRYLNIEGLSLSQVQTGLPGFTDSGNIAGWAAKDVEALRRTGLFQGDSAGRFRPGSSAKRSEAATMFMRLDQAVEGALAAEGEVLYSITDMDIGNGTATVSTARSAWLEVRILSEDRSRVLATCRALAKGGLSGEEVKVAFPAGLPGYFVAEAALVDESGAALCDTYTALEHTRAYEEFMALEVTDFDSEKVLNLDEDPANNFMVAAENALLLEEGEAYVEATADGSYWVYAAGDFQPGDRLVVQDGGNTLLLTVGSGGNGAALAVPDTNPDLDAYFDLIKIDTHISGAPLVDQPVSALAGQRSFSDSVKWFVDAIDITEADISKDGSLSVPLHFGAEFGVLALDVDAKLTVKVHFVLQYCVKLLSDKYVNVEFSASVIQSTDGKVMVKVEHDDSMDRVIDEIDLANLIIPLGVSGLAAEATLTAPVDWELTGGMTVHMDSEVEGGFKFRLNYNGEWGLHPISRNEGTATTSVEAEGEVKFGPKLEVGITYLHEIFEGKLNIFTGLVLKGTASHPLGMITSVAQPGAHACSLCVDGAVDTDITLGAEAGLHIDVPFTDITVDEKIIDGDIPIANEHLCDFYVSISNEAQSVHGGKLVCGLGDCPNYLWRVDFPVTDESGKAVTATVNTPGAKFSGKNCGYYYPGRYTASTTISGKTYSETFTVGSAPLTVPFTAKAAYLDAYAEILRKAMNQKYLKPSFALAYLDNDNIPELLVAMDGSHVAPADIYFYNNGNIKSYQRGVYGGFNFCPKTSMIYVSNMGSGIATDGFSTLNASGYKVVSTFHTDEFASVSNPGYWVNDKKVSKSTYERELTKAKNAYKWVTFEHRSKDDSRYSYKVTTANINRMLEHPAEIVLG